MPKQLNFQSYVYIRGNFNNLSAESYSKHNGIMPPMQHTQCPSQVQRRSVFEGPNKFLRVIDAAIALSRKFDFKIYMRCKMAEANQNLPRTVAQLCLKDVETTELSAIFVYTRKTQPFSGKSFKAQARHAINTSYDSSPYCVPPNFLATRSQTTWFYFSVKGGVKPIPGFRFALLDMYTSMRYPRFAVGKLRLPVNEYNAGSVCCSLDRRVRIKLSCGTGSSLPGGPVTMPAPADIRRVDLNR